MTERLTVKIVDGDGEVLAYRRRTDVVNISAIQKLGEYETAEEDGRMVVLPCKPWDKVYMLFIVDVIDKKPIYKIFQAKVTKITIDRFRVLFLLETLDENKYKSEITMEAFGETVFLTREEAKQTLKEMEER